MSAGITSDDGSDWRSMVASYTHSLLPAALGVRLLSELSEKDSRRILQIASPLASGVGKGSSTGTECAQRGLRDCCQSTGQRGMKVYTASAAGKREELHA